jgi:hypothetical protein
MAKNATIAALRIIPACFPVPVDLALSVFLPILHKFLAGKRRWAWVTGI